MPNPEEFQESLKKRYLEQFAGQESKPLNMAVGTDKKERLVCITFERPVAFLNLRPDQARTFAETILSKVHIIQSRKPSDGPMEKGGSE